VFLQPMCAVSFIVGKNAFERFHVSSSRSKGRAKKGTKRGGPLIGKDSERYTGQNDLNDYRTKNEHKGTKVRGGRFLEKSTSRNRGREGGPLGKLWLWDSRARPAKS